MSLLEVKNLFVNFNTYRGIVNALDGISFKINSSESVGIVGETGCGKSVTARAIMGFIEDPGEIINGQILLEGRNLLNLGEKKMTSIRGSQISFIFQEAKKALDPTSKIGDQLVEAAIFGRGIEKSEAVQLATTTLEQVGLADTKRLLRSYAFELSGGMAQRVMIAIAIVGGSKLIIADEPTSALDVSIQAQILHLLRTIRKIQSSALLLITHDLGVAAENCDRILVMYAGRVVESGLVKDIYNSPSHPYTVKLLNALPTSKQRRLEAIPGMVPDLIDPPKGCRFANRCDFAKEICLTPPDMKEITSEQFVACHFPRNGNIRMASLNGR